MAGSGAAPGPAEIGLSVADLTPLSEAGLRRLDAAIKPTPLDKDVLTPAPAHALSETIGRLAEALHAMQRGTEGDVEARRASELACKRLPTLQKEGRDKAAAARRAGSLLWRTSQAVKSDQRKLEAVMEICRIVAGDAEAGVGDPALFARFQDRRGKLVALQASQANTIQQLDLATKLMMDLLERHREVEGMVLPIWQQARLATVLDGPQPG